MNNLRTPLTEGQRIRRRRKLLLLSLQELAKMTGISTATISNLERDVPVSDQKRRHILAVLSEAEKEAA